jgi:hypothetical protein
MIPTAPQAHVPYRSPITTAAVPPTTRTTIRSNKSQNLRLNKFATACQKVIADQKPVQSWIRSKKLLVVSCALVPSLAMSGYSGPLPLGPRLHRYLPPLRKHRRSDLHLLWLAVHAQELPRLRVVVAPDYEVAQGSTTRASATP